MTWLQAPFLLLLLLLPLLQVYHASSDSKKAIIKVCYWTTAATRLSCDDQLSQLLGK
jgi:hypothetical protein